MATVFRAMGISRTTKEPQPGSMHQRSGGQGLQTVTVDQAARQPAQVVTHDEQQSV